MGRWPKISRIGAILTLVFGAFPATIFALLPVFGFVIGGIGGIVERDIGALAIAAWSALGLVGTYGLWRAVFGVIDRGTVVALSCGLVAFAIAILVWWPELVEDDLDPHGLVILFPPALIAAAHIARYFRRSQK